MRVSSANDRQSVDLQRDTRLVGDCGPRQPGAGHGEAVERIDLARSPAVAGLSLITKVLVQMHRDTQVQRRTLEQARMTPGLVEQVVTGDMLTAYCAQRADLRGYHCMLTTWREASFRPDMTVVVDRPLAVIREVEDDTKAVLGILAAALDVAPRA